MIWWLGSDKLMPLRLGTIYESGGGGMSVLFYEVYE
jgi:hypothetical protein